MKSRKPILVAIILAVTAALALFSVSCGGDDAPKTYTMSFETYGGTDIEPITAVGGSMIFVPNDPEKSGSVFAGWYTDPDFSGEAVTIPNVMPNKNVKYYAKFDANKIEYTVIYEYNKGQAPHAADIPDVTVEAGETVTVADGDDYGAVGYMFMGWSIYPNGLVSDVKQEGQYNPGDKITLTDSNVKLYAQWADEYTDSRKENADKIYVYEPLIGKGKGAAKLVRADKEKQDLDGFVMSGSETASGSTEFTFYADEFEGGEFAGRLYPNFTYATADGMQGQYAMYDYIFGITSADYILALDGFGYAVYLRRVGDMSNVTASGDYEYDPEQGDYIFKYTDEKAEDDAKPETTYFNVVKQEVENTQFDGVFTLIGPESGTFYNIDGLTWELNLRGYGDAYLNIYDEDGETITKTVEGVYSGTDYYESAEGEWQFEPTETADKSTYGFKFIIGVVQMTNGYYPVFRMCDETVVGTYTSTVENDKSTLYLDGYGMGQYVSNGVVYEGTCTVSEDGIATLVCTVTENDETVESERMVFAINHANMKFSISKGGIIVNDGGVLTDYQGTATIVEIPETVTEIAADAFNYATGTSGVSLTSVTVPATVTKIGARAFQNNYSLRRVILLGDTPAALDYTGADDNPFRWGAGDFTIVVPDTAVDTYKTASSWAAFADKIKGVTEAAKMPEWVTQTTTINRVEYNMLVQYNKQDDAEDDDLLDLIVPADITAIDSNVFSGLDFIRSIDLNNVVIVGDNAFYDCSNLETVTMTKVQSLGVMAFAACVKLNNSNADVADLLELPAIRTIGESAFSACESLRVVRLGVDITQIDDFAFYECNIYEADPPLMVDLGDGENAPTMGSKITLGNIAFRFKVKNIDVALKCYAASTWSNYCGHLYIESGDEKGMYISGGDTLELDGRALYQSSYVWMYAIDGENITFYEYNSSSTSDTHYTAIEGKYKDGVISFALGSQMRRFTRIQERMTYTSKDGKYTLECDPIDLQPESYENNRGYATVKFNGKDAQLYINGYNTKIIYNYEDADGKLYDIYVSFDGEALDITKKLSPIKYSDITAADGSKISILFQNGNIYIIEAEFEIVVDAAANRKLYWTEASGVGVLAEKNGNVYTFAFRFRNDTYNFTVTVSADNKTFTYTHTKA